ncbi:MAG TPA: type II toxin-antitoxin system HicB family antitoxin [Candidatus Saccharimonadia bacterium]|nr:type II toxin-antitoxin system HicB family antitoxin [Candidatus Saccharimonadia bacterium]
MPHVYTVPLLLTAQPEGGYTVTSPLLPELLTEGDTLEEALTHVQDAFAAVREMYEDMGKPLPVRPQPAPTSIHLEYAVTVP